MKAAMVTRRVAWPRALVLVLAAVWLMGLGGGTGSGGPQIPIPEQNFTATVSDTSGNTLQAKRFTWEGKVYFRAQYGNATVTLPFDKIQSVRVMPAEKSTNPELIHASVTLRSGETVDVTIERASKCYGETKFGNYEIFLKDIATITFQ